MAEYTFDATTIETVGPGMGMFIGFASGAITAGSWCGYDIASAEVVLLDKAITAAEIGAFGIALNGAVAEQPIQVLTGGEVIIAEAGIFANSGQLLIPSTTAGRCRDGDDIAVGDWHAVLGWSTNSDRLMVFPWNSGYNKAS